MTPPRLFLLASGGILLLLAAAGIALVAMGERDLLGQFLLFDTPHNVVHVALGVVALGLGLAPLSEVVAKRAALVAGVVYLALAVVGFVRGDLWRIPESLGWRMHLELGENMAHLILGGWGAYVGSQE